MQIGNKDQRAFIELVKAGLWEKSARLSFSDGLGVDAICNLADEQSVVGLVAAGLDNGNKAHNLFDPKGIVLQLIGQTLLLEKQNAAMNAFIGGLIEKMRKVGIYAVLVKGQGVAQCYERPLWRACGDVDLLLSDDNYEQAKAFLRPLASSVEEEVEYKKHLSMMIDGWVVELHGTLRSGLSSRLDKEIDDAQKAVFYGRQVRSWMNGKTQVFLPSADNDVFFIFTHFLKHFYKGGLGLRQICDWCRLLWTFRVELNQRVLESRLRKAGLVSEWKAFGAFAVEYLGMPSEVMPLYSSEKKWKRKADRICSFIMEVGNFGHNRDNSYYNKPFMFRKAFSFGRRCEDLFRHARIFPLDSLKFFWGITVTGVKAVFS